MRKINNMETHYLEHTDIQLEVHSKEECAGQNCTIHNRSDHIMRSFPQHWRSDRGIMERICPHGVGHPDPDSPWENYSTNWIHGCDGCCTIVNNRMDTTVKSKDYTIHGPIWQFECHFCYHLGDCCNTKVEALEDAKTHDCMYTLRQKMNTEQWEYLIARIKEEVRDEING